MSLGKVTLAIPDQYKDQHTHKIIITKFGKQSINPNHSAVA